jgi:uncharacterized protein
VSGSTTIPGPAGALEIAIDAVDTPRALALVCHPHPQFGGTMDNKVVTTLSRAFNELGACVLRFNFRGVGASAGTWDEGRGEIEDAKTAVLHLKNTYAATLPLIFSGFSFGGYVAAALHAHHAEAKLVLIAPAVSRFPVGTVPPETIVVHGETDDVVPLSAVFDWARPQHLPVTVLPGAGHFFHGQLLELRQLVKTLCHDA